MARVRSKGSKIERRVRATFVCNRLSGFRCNIASILGKPDFAFEALRIAVFVDSCFWHGCPEHCRMPANAHVYWEKKIERNRRRDRAVSRGLRRAGWSVYRVRECRIDSALPPLVRRISARVAKRLQ